MTSRAAPVADAIAAADPPPGVGSGEAKAESTSRSDLSVSIDDAPFLDDGSDGVRAHANQLDGTAVQHDGVQLLADFEAAHTIVAIERVRRVDRRADERLLEGECHPEARQRDHERHRRRKSPAG